MAEYIELEQVMQSIGNIRNIYSEVKNFVAVSAIDNVIGEIVDEVQAADVAPVVHAHWIDKWKCSACGEISYEEAKSDETDPNCYYVLSDYCPNCGAKMDEEGK